MESNFRPEQLLAINEDCIAKYDEEVGKTFLSEIIKKRNCALMNRRRKIFNALRTA